MCNNKIIYICVKSISLYLFCICVLPESSVANSSVSLYPQLYPPQPDNCFLLLKTVKVISSY